MIDRQGLRYYVRQCDDMTYRAMCNGKSVPGTGVFLNELEAGDAASLAMEKDPRPGAWWDDFKQWQSTCPICRHPKETLCLYESEGWIWHHCVRERPGLCTYVKQVYPDPRKQKKPA